MFSNRQLKRLIFPLFVEQLLGMLVGMLDTVMVSNAGEAAISGVSIVNDVNNLAIMLLSAIAGGGAVVVSQYLGNRDKKNSNLSAGQLVLLSLLISTGISVVCLAFYKEILHFLFGAVEADVMVSAETYFWITALSFPFLGMYNACAAIYRSMNLTKSTMYVSMIMNSINVIGNAILIYGFHMGAAGVAWPTLVSRAVAGILMMYLAFHYENVVQLKLQNILHFHKDMLGKIISIALPSGIENGLFQLGKIIVSAIVATFGTTQIAANGVANSLVILAYTTESTMQLAIVTVIGQCVGANDYDQAKYYIKKMVKLAYVMALVTNVIMACVFPFAIQIFHISSETASITLTISLMECIAIVLFHAPAFVLPCALRAAGDAKFTMYVGVISMFVARVGGAYVLGQVLGLGVIGTRIAMYIDWVVRIGFFVFRYVSNKWMNYRVVDA